MPKTYLFPQNTINEYPADMGSADAESWVTAEDGMDYVIKTRKKMAGLPASEWVCHNLADACGIPTPQYAQIQLMNGEIGFGSQWDESVVKDQATRNLIVTSIPGLPNLAGMFSAIYVIDLFSYNPDRHAGNYFFIKTKSGYGVKAYDFSRAFYCAAWPLPPFPLPAACNTVGCYRSLQVGYPFVLGVADETIRRIAAVPIEAVNAWLRDVPVTWMSDQQKAELASWWQGEMQARLNKITLGLRNGSLL